MICKRCPHLVRHGRVGAEGEIVFIHNCGLLMKSEVLEAGGDIFKKPGRKPTKVKERPVKKTPPKSAEGDHTCRSMPFPENFEYYDCSVYNETFKGSSRRADVVPTKDFQYLSNISGGSITDLELL